MIAKVAINDRNPSQKTNHRRKDGSQKYSANEQDKEDRQVKNQEAKESVGDKVGTANKRKLAAKRPPKQRQMIKTAIQSQ